MRTWNCCEGMQIADWFASAWDEGELTERTQWTEIFIIKSSIKCDRANSWILITYDNNVIRSLHPDKILILTTINCRLPVTHLVRGQPTCHWVDLEVFVCRHDAVLDLPRGVVGVDVGVSVPRPDLDDRRVWNSKQSESDSHLSKVLRSQ